MGNKSSSLVCARDTSTHPSIIQLDIDIRQAKISLDRNHLLIVSEDSKAIIFNLNDGREVEFDFPLASTNVIDGDWHPSGGLVLASTLGTISTFRFDRTDSIFYKINTYTLEVFRLLSWRSSTACIPHQVIFDCHGIDSLTFIPQTKPRQTIISRIPYRDVRVAAANSNAANADTSQDVASDTNQSQILLSGKNIKVGMTSPVDPNLLIMGTNDGEVLFLNITRNTNPPPIPRPLRSIFDRSGYDDAHDRRQKGQTAIKCRNDGFTARELRDAGYDATSLLPLCLLPPQIETKDGDMKCNFTDLINQDIICENKFGTITYVHATDKADIRCKYRDGSTNTINTHDNCIATDYLSKDSVRLLEFTEKHPRRFGSIDAIHFDASTSTSSNSDSNKEEKQNIHTTKTSFESEVSFLTSTQDGTLLLCGSMDNIGFIVVTKTRRIWHRLLGATSSLTCGAFTNATNNFCCIGSRDNHVRCYDVFDGTIKKVFSFTYLVSFVRFFPMDDFIVGGSWGQSCSIVSTKEDDDQLIWKRKFDSEIVDLFYGNDSINDALIIVTQEGEIHYISRSELSGSIGDAYEPRVSDMKYAFLSGTHKRLGAKSYVLMLPVDVIGEIFSFLFHSNNRNRNVIYPEWTTSSLNRAR